MSIGTPCVIIFYRALLETHLSMHRAQQLNVILDSGSSDLWLASNKCIQCPSGTPEYDSTKSSSFESSGNELVTIRYGSGAVQGTLGQDTVSLAGFIVSKQTFRKYSFCESL